MPHLLSYAYELGVIDSRIALLANDLEAIKR